MQVFKYRGGDQAVLKRDLISLSKNELYAASFSSLNDPFEATIVFDEKSFEIGSLILSRGDNQKFDQVKKANSSFRAAVDDLINITRNTGVYSLSKTATDELLWAHYANSHQGFCLEFDLRQLLSYKLENEEVLDVEYVSSPPIISISEFSASGSASQSLLKKLTATKSLRWSYEEEIRICVGEPGLREYDFRALKAIYFGVRCRSRWIRLAMRLLRGRGLSYYQMQLVKNSYHLEAIPIEDNYPNASPYKEHLAAVNSDIPYLDEKTKPYEKELHVAIEIARREPYCERVLDIYLSGTKGTLENPVFYVTYERSDGSARNVFYSLQEIRNHTLYKKYNSKCL